MCHYITLVVGGVPESDVDRFMRSHGRKAELVFNASVQKILASNELHFLTTKGHCDCGTVLDHSERLEQEQPELAVTKLRAKGWSQAKVDRWLADKEKSSVKEPRASSVDSVEFWATLIRDLGRSLSPTSAGLLLHYYRGGIGSDKFTPRRIESVHPQTIEDALETMREDELIIFTLTR